MRGDRLMLVHTPAAAHMPRACRDAGAVCLLHVEISSRTVQTEACDGADASEAQDGVNLNGWSTSQFRASLRKGMDFWPGDSVSASPLHAA
ncbi:MAG: hypothetical protein ACPIOQ_58050 [Promethearchaeia archaeon]